MNRDEQLQWEARWGRPAAIAAFLAGAMQLVSAMLFFPKDRKGIEATPDFLLSIDENSGCVPRVGRCSPRSPRCCSSGSSSTCSARPWRAGAACRTGSSIS